MNNLTKDNLTGRMVRKYRKEKGWTLSADPKHGSSLLQKIQDRFGDQTCKRLTKRETFKNLEAPGKRHIELTAKELYQVATTLGIPMFALLVDYDAPLEPSALDANCTTLELVIGQGKQMQLNI